MVDAASEFKKSGFTDEDAATLAGVAAMYQNVADEAISTGEAANFIVSQMKAFGLTADDAIHIVDALNEVSNTNAVSSADLANNIGKASAAMALGNNTYEQTLGLMTAITEINRSGAKSARALVSVQSRLTQVLDEQSSTGKALTQIYGDLGIALKDEEGQLRPTYDIFKDLAELWPNLTTNQKDYIALTQAGSNQTQNFVALMDNFDTALKAEATALDSSGSALRENTAYMSSLEAQTNNLKAEFQDLANNVISKELVQGGLSLASNALQLLNTGIGQTITQTTLLTGLLGGGAVIFGTILTKVVAGVKSLTQLGAAISVVKTALSGAAVSAGALSAALFPIGAAIGIIGGALLAISKTDWFKLNFQKAQYVEEKIGDINTQISETQQKIEELKEQGASQNVIDMYSEKLDALSDQLNEFNAEKFHLAFAETDTSTVRNWAMQDVNAIEAQIQKLGELKTAMNEATDTTKFEKLQEQYYKTAESLEEYYNIGKEANDQGVEFTKTEADLYYQLAELYGSTKDLAEASVKLNIANGDNIYTVIGYTKQLYGEAEQLGFTKDEMADLIAKSIMFNNTGLDVSQKISALQSLASAAGVASSMLTGIGTSSDQYNNYISNALGEGLSLEQAQSQYLSYLWGKWNRNKPTASTPTTATDGTTVTGNLGGSSGKTSSSQKKEKTAVEQANEAWKEQLGLLKDRLELIQKSGGTEEQQVAQMRKIQDAIHKQAEAYRQLGLDEDSEYLRELGILWWDYESGIEDIYDKMAEKAKEAAEEARKAWEDELNKQKSDYETAASYVVDKIQDEIDNLQSLRDETEQYYNDKIQALKDSNDELDKQIQYEELLNKLAQAKQKKLYVFKDGQFQYVQDVEAISSAQADLDAYERERALEQEAANLEKLKDEALKSIDDQIAGWQEYKDEWANVVQQYTDKQNQLIAEQVLGIDLEQKNWEKRLMNAQAFADKYNAIMSNLSTASTEGAISAVGGSSNMSTSDLNALAQAGRDYNNATTDAERNAAHARAEAIRAKYGYSGGSDGSQYIPTTSKSSSSSSKSSSSSGSSVAKAAGSAITKTVTSVIKALTKHANGTLGAPGGLSLVGEQGPELRVLGHGDGVIPADVTRNLWAWGKINPASMATGGSTIFNIDNLSLPNARDAESLVSGLKQMAYQRAYKRA